jgi:hypothetical protein
VSNMLLLWRLVQGRLRPAAALAATALLFAFAWSSVMLIQRNSATALETSVKVSSGGFPYLLQPQSSESEDALSGRSDMTPVWLTAGTLATGSAEVPVDVRASTRPVHLASVLTGVEPSRPGEIALSVGAIEDLNASVGDQVALRDAGGDEQIYTVVGTAVDTAQRDSRFAVAVLGAPRNEQATWLTSTSLDAMMSDGAISPLLASRAILFRTVTTLASDSSVPVAGTFSSSVNRYWPLGVTAAGLLFGAILIAMRRDGRRITQSLAAAGLETSRSWRLLLSAALMVLVAGVIVGDVLAVVAIHLLSDRISAGLNQYWVSNTLSLLRTLAFVMAAPMGVVVAVVLTYVKVPAPRKGRRRRAIVGFALLVSALWWALIYTQVAGVAQVPLAGMLTVAAVALLVPTGQRGGAGESSLTERIGRSLSIPAILTAVSLVLAGLHVAELTGNVNRIEQDSFTTQPEGSFIVFGVSTSASRLIEQKYESLGGRDAYRLLIPDESSTNVRVSSSGLVDCMREENLSLPDPVLQACGPQDTYVPINVVALSPGHADAGPRADPALIDGHGVGLLTFDVKSSLVTRTTLSPAVADRSLGGNLPGLVVPADSEAALGLGLRPSGSEYLVLSKFSSLTTREQAAMRSTITHAAGAAQTSQDQGLTYDGADSIAKLTIAMVGIVASLIWLGLGGSYLSTHRRIRRDLAALGASAAKRRSLALRSLVPTAAALLTTLPVISFGAWLQRGREGSSGLLWALPSISVLVILLVTGVIFSRVPEDVATEY